MRPKIEYIFPLIRSISIVLKTEKYEAVRFTHLKPHLRSMLEEVASLLNQNTNIDKQLELYGDFGDLSRISEEDSQADNFLELSR